MSPTDYQGGDWPNKQRAEQAKGDPGAGNYRGKDHRRHDQSWQV